MANPALANFLSHYHRHQRGHIETPSEHNARIEAWDALPHLEKAVASVLYSLDNQVGGNAPDQTVHIFASTLQDLAQDLYDALQREAHSVEEPTPPGV